MGPNPNFVLTDASGEPVSRTYQYRKVMKPMLERKRRARINRCLDELKELMTGALQTEGENVAKLEKADILELTVRHLHTLRRQNVSGVRSENSYAEKFKAGFRHCAAEVSNFLGVMDQDTSVHVLKHLNSCINHMDRTPTVNPQTHSPNRSHATGGVANVGSGRPAIHIQSPNQINAHAVATRQPNQVIWQQQQHNKTGSPVPSQPMMAIPSPPAIAVSAPHHYQYLSDEQKHQIMLQQHQYIPTKKSKILQHPYAGRSANSSPEILIESSTRINTPPMSPKIDVDDSSVWRPW